MQGGQKLRVKYGKADSLPLSDGGLGRGAGQEEADWVPVPPAQDPSMTCRRRGDVEAHSHCDPTRALGSKCLPVQHASSKTVVEGTGNEPQNRRTDPRSLRSGNRSLYTQTWVLPAAAGSQLGWGQLTHKLP